MPPSSRFRNCSKSTSGTYAGHGDAAILTRPARWSDRDAILNLVVQMGGHDEVPQHHDPMRRLGAALRRSDTRVIVALADERVVGYAEVQARASTVNDRHEAWLGALAVEPEFRSHGAGAMLLAAVDDAARELGCSHVELESSQWRDRAHGFYRRNGYVERSPALRFERAIPPLKDTRPLEERFLEAAARAASAVASAIVELGDIAPVGMGADGAPTEAADRAAERAVLDALAPLGVPIVSEEAGVVGQMPGPDDAWIALDPLDGSRNFRAGYPPYATCMGLVQRGVALAGFVCDLTSGRRYSGWRGKFARADGRDIRARRGPLIGIPSPDGAHAVPEPGAFAQRIRIAGATSIDLCRVADGSLAAFVASLRPVVHVHDLAGPLAILLEAGATVIDERGETPHLAPDPTATILLTAAADRELALDLAANARTR